ncbi:MAG TPA: hypothetical protein PLD27_01005 [bacterium]|nr:hypothetical protein [bacterium]HOL48479.1 hypothetical protein [bacterium]HPQ17715.1 hypothetical protein [bacterium]
MIDLQELSKKVRETLHSIPGYVAIKEIFKQLPSEYKFYVVGGILRDTIKGRQSKIKDMDVLVEYGNTQYIYNILKDKGIVRKSMLGSIKFSPAGIDFAFDIWRVEDSMLEEGEEPTVENALKKFDITANAVAYEFFNGRIVDPIGGLQAIEDNIIEVIPHKGNEPIAWRVILRCIKYAVKLDAKITEKTKEWMRAHSYQLDNVSDDEIKYVLRGIEKFNKNKAFERLYEEILGRPFIVKL